jgi:uncharacterized protein YaiI (UPF0178 family)
MKAKFIITQDEQTAKLLMDSGFKVVGHFGTTYTFLNEVPQNFSFAHFDTSKIAYTSILSL